MENNTLRDITASRLDLAFSCQAWRLLPAVRLETAGMRRGIDIHALLEKEIYVPISDLGKVAVTALIETFGDYEVLGTEVSYSWDSASDEVHKMENAEKPINDECAIRGRIDLIIRSPEYGIVVIDWKTGGFSPHISPDSWQLRYAALVTGANVTAIGIVDTSINEVRFLSQKVSPADCSDWKSELRALLSEEVSREPRLNDKCSYCDSVLFCPLHKRAIETVAGIEAEEVAAIGDALLIVERWSERAKAYLEDMIASNGPVVGRLATWTLEEKSRRVVDTEHPRASELLVDIPYQVSYQVTKIPKDRIKDLEAAGVIKKTFYKSLVKKLFPKEQGNEN